MDDDVFDKIEAYVSGEMNSEEKNHFENEMSANGRLARRVELYKKLEQTLKLSQFNKDNENSLQQTIAAIHDEYINKPGKARPIRRINKWYAAAAAILVIALSVFIFQKSNRSSNEELYARYAVFPVLSGTRGSNDTLLARATMYYNSKQFAEAAPLLKQSLAADSSDMELRLAFYICFLQTGNYAEALHGFSKVAAAENVFTYQAKWYMALTLLKQGNIKECKKILTGIPASADIFSQARQLLKDLNN